MERRSKYHARKVTIDGITFDSGAEARRYGELKLLEKAGEIRDLQVHVIFRLIDGFDRHGEHIRPTTYEADFVYHMTVDPETLVVEDVKGVHTAVYQIKRKLFLQRYPDVAFREVDA